MTAATMIQRIVNNDPTFKDCDLSIIGISSVSELAEGLKANRYLLKLNLSEIPLGFDFSGKETALLAAALKVNTALTELVLQDCRLSHAKELAEALKSNRTLIRLNMGGNSFNDEARAELAGAFKVNVGLTDLSLEGGYRDAEVLTEVLTTNRCLTKFNLSGNRLTNAGRVALAGALKVNVVLRELDISSCQLNDVTELAEVLKTNRCLTKLNLSRNRLGNTGGVALAGALRVNAALTELNMEECDLKMIDALAESLKTNRTLFALNLRSNHFNNPAGTALAGALKVNVALTKLDLQARAYNDAVTFTDIRDLAEALKTNRSLSTLVLNFNKFGNVGIRALASTLNVNVTLTELRLRGCNFTDITELAAALERNRSLSTLDLSISEFGNAGGKALAVALKMNTALTDLDLDGCGLTDIKELAEALKTNRSLLRINLSSNKIANAGGAALTSALKVNVTLTELNLYLCDLTDITEIADTLKTNRSLRTLELRSNKIGNAGGIALAGALKVNVTLTSLDLGGCGLSLIQDFAETLKTNSSLSTLNLAANEYGNAGGKALLAALKVNSTLIELSPDFIDHELREQIDDKIKFNQSLQFHMKQNPVKEKDAKIIAAATTAAGSSVTAALDDETIDRLKALPGKHDALARQVQKLAVLDTSTMQALEGRADALQRMFEAEALSTLNKHEKDLIHANSSLQVYYDFFSRLFTGTWMACQTINSGLVQNSKKENLDYVGQGIDEIGKRIPVVSVFTGIFSGIISAWTAREKTIAVQRIALLFPDLESAFKDLGRLARQLTLAQREAILTIESQPLKLVDKLKGGAKDLKATLLGEDVKGVLKRKAVEDCEKILTAIRDEKPKAQPTVADLLTVVLGANFVYKPAPLLATTVAAAAMPTTAISPTQAAASSPQSPTTEELLERLRKMEEREQQREAELKRLKAKLEEQKPNDEEEVSEGNMAQAQLSASKVARRTANADPATAAAAHAEVHHHVQVVTTRVDVHDARLGEHADDILALKEQVKQLKKGK